MAIKNLLPFCWLGECPRYPALSKPFRIADWVYATDGQICVRVPAEDDLQPIDAIAIPKANRLFNEFDASACTVPWPRWDGQRRYRGCGCEEIAPQRIAERLIGGLYWLKVASLGGVFYAPTGTAEDGIHFVSGDLQGILLPLEPKSCNGD